MHGLLAAKSQALQALASRPCLTSPYALLDERRRDLSRAEERLFSAPLHLIDQYTSRLKLLSMRLDARAQRICQAPAALLDRLAAALSALSPLSVLERGYAIVRAEEGRVVSSCGQVEAGDALTIQLSDGSIRTKVTGIQEEGIDHE